MDVTDLGIKNEIDEENQFVEYVEEVEVTTRGVDFSVRELRTLVREEELIIPPFQRELVWDAKRKSRFIESILLGYPIPGMFFTDYAENVMMIIDGQQRIHTLIDYLDNNFALSNISEINPKWVNKRFNDLDTSYQRKLRSTNIRTAVFQILSDSEEERNIALYSLFERINTGSIQLNSQEIRRAIYFGEFVERLQFFAEKEIWKSAYRMVSLDEASNVEADKRLQDQEILARYFTLKHILDSPFKSSSSISYKKEINSFMLRISHANSNIINSLFQELEANLIWLEQQVAETTNYNSVGVLFRRHELKESGEGDSSYTKKINVPLFEALMYVLSKHNLDEIKFNKERFLKLFADEKFIDAITSQTNRLPKIMYRVEKIEEIFE